MTFTSPKLLILHTIEIPIQLTVILTSPLKTKKPFKDLLKAPYFNKESLLM